MKIKNFNYNGRSISKALMVKSGEEVNLTTVSVYDKPHQEGKVTIRAVVMGDGYLKLKGMVKINKNSFQANGFLSHKILLIGNEARAEAIPELEIECDDVKASHAASIGRIDEEQLFYLMSRGIDREEAVKLIVKAFMIL